MKDVKIGDFSLVQFIGSDRNKKKFTYVCCVNNLVENSENNIQVQGLQKENYQSTHFSIKENDVSYINIEMVLAILPEPLLIECNRKFIYEFSQSIQVNEK